MVYVVNGGEMNLEQKIGYNEQQSEKYGWTPEWFGCTAFDSDLIDAIAKFQSENGLSADGLCGPSTYRRLWTQREEEQEYHQIDIDDSEKFIIYNTVKTRIFWDKVIVWNETGGQESSSGTYSSYAGEAPRKPRFMVTHWDVCLSSSSCYRVLEQRGISVHFGIDNDGTIWQWLDCQHAAWHAGSRTWNHASVGVEMTDAYDQKYQSWYRKHGFGDRPIVEGAEVHGRTLDPFLGFYDVQLQALAALWEAVSFACEIPLELPLTPNTVDPKCEDGFFKGFCNHYHLTERKIDCAGLDNNAILEKAKEIRQRRWKDA